MEAIELDFIPCDLCGTQQGHKDVPALQMEITNEGKVRFYCGACTR